MALLYEPNSQPDRIQEQTLFRKEQFFLGRFCDNILTKSVASMSSEIALANLSLLGLKSEEVDQKT